MQKVYPVSGMCPTCRHEMHVTKLACTHCQTTIEGKFHLSKFNYLEKETLYFIEIFIKNRGNIKAIEKELNISYPTVKKLLDEALTSLGYAVDEEEEAPPTDTARQATLDALSRKEISVSEAIKILKVKEGKNNGER